MNNDVHILNFWADYMRAQHCTDRTIRERLILMRSVLRHTGAESLTTINRLELISFLGRSDLTGRTKQNYKSALHTFFTWMQDEGFRPDNPAARLPRPRVERKEVNPVTTDDIQTVLDSGIYGHTVLKVLLYSYQGLRASEIARVHGDDIDWEHRRIKVRGKGRTQVWRPIHPIAWDYITSAGYPTDDHFFPGLTPGSHVRGKSVSNVLNTAFRRAGVNGHRAHDMRAWHATELLEAGVDHTTVRHSMRHWDDQSLKHYDKASDHRIASAGAKLPTVRVPRRRRPLTQRPPRNAMRGAA